MLYAVTNLKEFDVVKANTPEEALKRWFDASELKAIPAEELNPGSYVCGVARPCNLLEVYEYESMETDYCRMIDLMEHKDGINYQMV